MVKLSARGATILYRVTRAQHFAHAERTTSVVSRRTERALRSDGKVLEKHTIKYGDSSRPLVTGWAIRGKLPAGLLPADWAAGYRDRGWTVAVPATSVTP